VRTHRHAPHTSLCTGCACVICACASPVSVHRWCCVVAAPPGACRLPPRPRPTRGSRLRRVDALLPCANPCARTSACLAGYCARSSCYENLSAPSTCAHNPCTYIWPRNLACAALWRLSLEQLLCVLPRAQKCVATKPLRASPAHLHPCTPLLAYIDTKPHHSPSSVPMRCPSSMHCFAALIRHKTCLAMPPIDLRRPVLCSHCTLAVSFCFGGSKHASNHRSLAS